MEPQDEYLTIPELAELFKTSERHARQMAKSKRLRSIKGAVIDVNMSKGKYEILKVNKKIAEKVFSVC